MLLHWTRWEVQWPLPSSRASSIFPSQSILGPWSRHDLNKKPTTSCWGLNLVLICPNPIQNHVQYTCNYAAAISPFSVTMCTTVIVLKVNSVLGEVLHTNRAYRSLCNTKRLRVFLPPSFPPSKPLQPWMGSWFTAGCHPQH